MEQIWKIWRANGGKGSSDRKGKEGREIESNPIWSMNKTGRFRVEIHMADTCPANQPTNQRIAWELKSFWKKEKPATLACHWNINIYIHILLCVWKWETPAANINSRKTTIAMESECRSAKHQCLFVNAVVIFMCFAVFFPIFFSLLFIARTFHNKSARVVFARSSPFDGSHTVAGCSGLNCVSLYYFVIPGPI